MRERERVVSIPLSNPQSISTDITWTNPNHPPFHSADSFDLVGSYNQKVEMMADIIALRPQVYIDPITGRWRRYRYPRSQVAQALKPVHPCTHSSSRIRPSRDISMTWGGMADVGNEVNERTYSFTHRFSDGASYIANLSTDGDVLHYLESADVQYTAGPYILHDWFALADSFYESCDQFIHSSFNLGEDIAESDIFREAILGVVFPTRAINRLLKYAIKRIKHSKRMNLGQVTKAIAGSGVNAHLSYIFGVKPAVDDIKAVLSAHLSVSKRMSILRSKAGHFIPVRVRRVLDSSFDNSLPSFSPSGEQSLFVQCERKSSIATASAFGRVREDLTFDKTWSAYLQYFGINKFVGLAWELIPFSFVVDWFTNAQERLNSLTRLNTGGPFTEIRGLTVSRKNVLSEAYYMTPGVSHVYSYDMTAPLSPIHILSKDTIDYQRYLSFPDTSGVFDFSALGLFQYTAGLSLILQRLLVR